MVVVTMGLREGKGFRTERPSEPTRVASDCLWGQSVGWIVGILTWYAIYVRPMKHNKPYSRIPASEAGCNGMLPRSATLCCQWQHSQCTIILPPGAIQSCHSMRRVSIAKSSDPRLHGELRSEQPGSKAGFVRYPPGTRKIGVRQCNWSAP